MPRKTRTEDDLTLGDLRTLIRVSEAQSFEAAARKLKVNRTSVPRRLENLKKWASGRDMYIGNQLTPDGKRLVELVRPMLETLDAFRNESPKPAPQREPISGRDIKVTSESSTPSPTPTPRD